MKTTKIKSKKNLYNFGKCFTKGKIYQVEGIIQNTAGLMEKQTINDHDQVHIIVSWWR